MFPKTLTSAGRLCVLSTRQAVNVRNGQSKLSTSAVNSIKYAPLPKPLANKMKIFQLPNGLPVHLKGGPVDKMLYIVTMSICIIGLVECFHVYYVLSYPQKKN